MTPAPDRLRALIESVKALDPAARDDASYGAWDAAKWRVFNAAVWFVKEQALLDAEVAQPTTRLNVRQELDRQVEEYKARSDAGDMFTMADLSWLLNELVYERDHRRGNAEVAARPDPPHEVPLRCSGCGLRWSSPEGFIFAGVVHLCGDCWRKVQTILHKGDAEVTARPEPQDVRCEACDAGYRLAADSVHYNDARGGRTWGVCRKFVARIAAERDAAAAPPEKET